MAPAPRLSALLTGVGIAAVTVGVAATGSATGNFDSRWYWRLRNPVVDDEPYTDEERAEDDAALERFGQGDYVPLEDLRPRSGQGR